MNGVNEPIVIWGAGAIGGALGAAFIKAGHEVIFVDNAEDHIKAINESGLRIAGPIFEYTVNAPAFLPQDLKGEYKTIFLGVKSLHTEAATTALKPHLAQDGVVVSAQNGLNELVIADIIGKDRTIGCFVNFGADYLEPGLVHYSGRGAVVIGELDGAKTDRVQALHALLCEFDKDAILTDNIWGFLWGKLVYGTLLYASALTNDSIADVLDNKEFREVLTALSLEIGKIAAAEGVRTEAFNGFDPAAFTPGASQDQITASFDDMVAHNRRSLKSHSGIWRDLAVRKRRTEVVDQIGPIVEIAAKHGIPTPLTARLIDMIVEMENGRRTFAGENLAELAAAAV